MKRILTLDKVSCVLGDLRERQIPVIQGQEAYFERVKNLAVSFETLEALAARTACLGVTSGLMEIVDHFRVPEGELPAGFRPELRFNGRSELLVDLHRDISYGKNGEKRGTGVLFSADCANPYEISAMKGILANITTNPSIIYDRFLNNERANVGRRFHTKEEVLSEIGRIVGPGVDISVEIDNPFAEEERILDEMAHMAELLSPYRIVVKVPHLGPLNSNNISSLVEGSFPLRYNQTGVTDPCRSHDLAIMLREHGYRVNFTLMAEPYQTAIALQVKPAFINCFMRNRYYHSEKMASLLNCYQASQDEQFLVQLRDYMVEQYYLTPEERELSLFEVKRRAEWELEYRGWNSSRGKDGLDQARHCLRMLGASNLPDTRLIVCSMAGEKMYPLLDQMLMEEEFRPLSERVIISASPDYLCSFTSSPAVLNYNKSFVKAAGNLEVDKG